MAKTERIFGGGGDETDLKDSFTKNNRPQIHLQFIAEGNDEMKSLIKNRRQINLIL